MNNRKKIENFIKRHQKEIVKNPKRSKMIKKAVDNREAIVSESGAMATWTPKESTGRSPKDTVFVKRKKYVNFVCLFCNTCCSFIILNKNKKLR